MLLYTSHAQIDLWNIMISQQLNSDIVGGNNAQIVTCFDHT